MGEEEKQEGIYATATFYEALDPLSRCDKYEDPLTDWFEANPGVGEVDGGGTMLSKDGGIACCDVTFVLYDVNRVDDIVKQLEAMGAPRGSQLTYGDKTVRFGLYEGMAITFPGDEVEKSNEGERNINYIFQKLNELLEGVGSIDSSKQTKEVTILYAYGKSYDAMKACVEDFLKNNPLGAFAELSLVPEHE